MHTLQSDAWEKPLAPTPPVFVKKAPRGIVKVSVLRNEGSPGAERARTGFKTKLSIFVMFRLDLGLLGGRGVLCYPEFQIRALSRRHVSARAQTIKFCDHKKVFLKFVLGPQKSFREVRRHSGSPNTGLPSSYKRV